MENIGAKLKKIRESKKMSRKTVADKLKEYGIDISDKTLYGYEVGRTSANADMFLALCEIYEIKDILGVFYDVDMGEDKEVLLSPFEQKIIDKLRFLDKEGQQKVLNLIESELEYTRLRQYVSLMKAIKNQKEDSDE